MDLAKKAGRACGIMNQRFLKTKVATPPSKLKLFAELSKFRLSSLVVFTSGAGFLAAGAPVDICTMAATCVGTALCAASAGTFNQIFEIEQDKQMKRTLTRPLPSGNVTKTEAAAWGGLTGAAGTGLLLAASNPTVAMLGLGNILLYAGPYTYSKMRTEMNTWIGSVVGAIPPIMGWCAAGGSLMAAEPWALASILFLWQFPHFFALSWLYREDYARGGFQMVACNDAIGARSADYIQEYSYYLAAVPILTSVTGLTSYMFAVEGTIANIYLLSLAHKFKQDHSNANARRIFLCSLWYLPLLLVGYVFHSRAWNTKKITEEAAEGDQISEAVVQAKETLKGMCVHEMILSNDNSSVPQMCVKVQSDKVVEAVVDAVPTSISTELPKAGTPNIN